MGKIVQVKPGYVGVTFEPYLRSYGAGEQVTLTDAEYAAQPSSVVAAVTIITSGVADPVRGTTVGTAIPPYQFPVESYGAVGNGTTDDTVAINSAVTAATTYALANNFYAEVLFKPKTYLVSGSLTQGGSTKGNALIPLPVVATTGQKPTLLFKGAGDASALPHWQTTVGQQAGTVLKTTVTGTQDGTYGEASVIGGPTPAQGYGAATRVFNNIFVGIDGIQILAPSDPHICGVDLRGVAQARIGTLGVFANAGPATPYTAATTSWAHGLLMPEGGNNAIADIESYSCEGFVYGLLANEHTVANSIRCVYCIGGLYFGKLGSNGHFARINYAAVEACQVALGALDTAYVNIEMLDVESGTGSFNKFKWINDSLNELNGKVNINVEGLLSAGDINGAANLEIHDINRPPGAVAAPTVPATATPTLNPFFHNAAVTIVGGTVSAIKIAGTAVGVTSGTVILPTNKTIELDYTVAPTWVWTLL